jgi:hypothetical protein
MTLEIMRLRAFAEAGEEAKRPRRADEEIDLDDQQGAIHDWVQRIQRVVYEGTLNDEDSALSDVRRIQRQQSINPNEQSTAGSP